MRDEEDVEKMLGRYRPAGPGGAGENLRARVVAGARKQQWWVFAQGIAAMLLVGLNLAQIGASVTKMLPEERPVAARTEKLAAEIGKLDLGLGEDEQYVLAQQMEAGEHLRALPLIHGGPAMDETIGGLR